MQILGLRLFVYPIKSDTASFNAWRFLSGVVVFGQPKAPGNDAAIWTS